MKSKQCNHEWVETDDTPHIGPWGICKRCKVKGEERELGEIIILEEPKK